MGRGGSEENLITGLRGSAASESNPVLVRPAAIAKAESDILRIAEESGDPILLANARRAVETSQIDREAGQEVQIELLADHPLGFGREDLINTMGRLSYRQMKRNRMVEGFDFEDALVESYKEIGIPAWDDENKTNKGADIYVTRKQPRRSLVSYLESQGGEWNENLFFQNNEPWVRYPNGAQFPLPEGQANEVWEAIAGVSVKTKASAKSDPEVLSYELIHQFEKAIGPPRVDPKGNPDLEWLNKAMDKAVEHTDNYETSLIGHYVPELDGEDLSIKMSMRELPPERLQDRLSELQKMLRSSDPVAAFKAMEPEIQVVTSNRRVSIFFTDPDKRSIGNPDGLAPKMELRMTSAGFSVKVHVDELNTCSSFSHAPPPSRAVGFLKGAQANIKAAIFRDCKKKGERPPPECLTSGRKWWRF